MAGKTHSQLRAINAATGRVASMLTPTETVLSPAGLFQSVGVMVTGQIPWRQRISSSAYGVYIVSLHGDVDDPTGLAEAPLDRSAT
jgi:hypothetical protein